MIVGVQGAVGRLARVAAALALLGSSAACGARWTDEQRAEVLARASGSAPADAGTGTTVGSSGGGSTTSGGVAADGAGTSAAGPGAGSSAAGPSGAGAAGGPAPCSGASDAPGVTDDQIVVAAISSLTGPVPGLGASSAAATRAHVAYRNAIGGVCGRQIVLREADDGTDNGRYRAAVSGLAPGVLGIAGGFALGDVGGVEVIRDQALPVVNVPSGEPVSSLPTVFDINPDYASLDAVIGKYRYLYDQGARKAALGYLAVDQSRAEAQIQRRLMEAAGIQVVQVQELPLSTLSYDSTARRVANSGADYLFFIGDTGGNASMAAAVRDTGYQLRFAEYFTFAYGTDFIALAGSGAEGATSWLRTLPNEDAAGNPEMATFLEWMDRVAPGDVTDVFAADAWAGTKAFFDVLESLPGPISREALVAQLGATGRYDAGGMLGPIDLGAEQTHGCVVGMRVEGGQWRRMAPAEGFLC